MLKVVEERGADGSRILRLEGRLVERWVEEMRRAAAALGDARGLVIDLRDVSFLDASGVALLQDLAGSGARLVNASPFVTEQLRTPANSV